MMKKAKPGTKPCVGIMFLVAAPPFELPAILLFAELHDPAFAMRIIPSIAQGGPPEIEITNESDILMQAVVRQDWYFDPVSGAPIRVEYNLPDSNDSLASIRGICDFLTFRAVNEILFPTSMDVYEAGKRIALVTINSTQTNTPISATQFDLQSGGAQ